MPSSSPAPSLHVGGQSGRDSLTGRPWRGLAWYGVTRLGISCPLALSPSALDAHTVPPGVLVPLLPLAAQHNGGAYLSAGAPPQRQGCVLLAVAPLHR